MRGVLYYRVCPVMFSWFKVSAGKTSALILKHFNQEFFVTFIWIVEQTKWEINTENVTVGSWTAIFANMTIDGVSGIAHPHHGPFAWHDNSPCWMAKECSNLLRLLNKATSTSQAWLLLCFGIYRLINIRVLTTIFSLPVHHLPRMCCPNYTCTLILVSFASHLQTSSHQAGETCPGEVPATRNYIHKTESPIGERDMYKV